VGGSNYDESRIKEYFLKSCFPIFAFQSNISNANQQIFILEIETI